MKMLFLFIFLISFQEIKCQSADKYYLRAEKQLKEGRISKGRTLRSIKNYTKSIERNPTFRDAYFWRAWAKMKLEDYKSAIEDYNKVIELEPHSDPYCLRASAQSSLKDYKGAIESYTKAIELDSLDASTFISRGEEKYKAKDYKGAISDYKKAIEISPTKYEDNPDTYFDLMQAMFEMENYKETIKVADRLIEGQGLYMGPSYYYRAASFIYLGEKATVCTDLAEVVKWCSNNSWEDYSIKALPLIEKYCK